MKMDTREKLCKDKNDFEDGESKIIIIGLYRENAIAIESEAGDSLT